MTEMAGLGMSFPQRPLPAYPPDPGLGVVPYLYFKVDPTMSLPLYGSLEAAEAHGGASQYISPGFVYVSYITHVENDKGHYFMLPSGEWFPGDGSRVGYGNFQGLIFTSTPKNAFGWVRSDAEIRNQPSYTGTVIDKKTRFNIVQVYAAQKVKDTDWYLIGPDQWIEGRLVARVIPNTTPPEGVTNGRWIEVNLEEQTLAVYDNSQLVFATLLSSGLDPFFTKPGLFQIYKKKTTETMSGSFEADHSDYYYLEDVPWTMYYDEARALHGAYWHTYFGYPQSHGCVNLSLGDSHWLFDWAKEGDWVYVHDPSGNTPTDPSLYGAGAP
jgi:lipoprotein-anchoring transpeptidase ErfK/SrfK